VIPPQHADKPGTGEVPALSVDAIGKKCPLPIIMLARRIAEVPVGGLIEVLADDPAARADVPAWCRLKSHEFVLVRDIPAGAGGWAFLVRRSY
jgi:tRNA 2-thiouridine synthesizing protein A